MKITKLFLVFLFVTLICVSSNAQQTMSVRVDEFTADNNYSVSLLKIIEENFQGLGIENDKNPRYVWSEAESQDCNQLPSGLAFIYGKGLIIGNPEPTDINDFCFMARLRDKEDSNLDLYLKIRLRKKRHSDNTNLASNNVGIQAKNATAFNHAVSTSQNQSGSTSELQNGNVSQVSNGSTSASQNVSSGKSNADPKKSSNSVLDNPYTRAIVGIEQVGSSSSTSESKPFVDFFFTLPNNKYRTTWGFWGNIKITSTPSTLSSLGVFSTNVSDSISTKGEIVQGFDFLAGAERMINKNVSLTFSLGGVTPFIQNEKTVKVFKVPSESSAQFSTFKERFPQSVASNKPYIAFVFPERDRFLRQYFVGLRIRSWGDDKNRFPSLFDFTVGQSEAVTGGKFVGPVFRFDGAYRLPFFEKSLFIFGNATFHTAGKKEGNIPLFLQPPSSTDVNVFNNDVFIMPDRPKSRDVYRIGLGFNLSKLFSSTQPN